MKLMSHGCWEGQGTKSAWPFADTRPFAYAHTQHAARRPMPGCEWVSEWERAAPAKHNMQTRTSSCRILALALALWWIPFILCVPSMQMSVPATNVFSQAEETDSRTRWFINDICTYIWTRTSKSHQPLSTRIWKCLLMAIRVMSKVVLHFADFTRAIRSLN